MEPTRTHLDRIMESGTFDEILEHNDLTHTEVLDILYDLGYLLYPEDNHDKAEEPEFESGYNG